MLNKNSKKLPLRVYLSLSFLIFSAVLIIIMWLFQTVFFDSFYRIVKTNQVEKCASSVCDNLSSDSLTTIIRDIENQNSMSVSVYDTSTQLFSVIYAPNHAMGISSALNMSSIYRYYHQAKENGGQMSETFEIHDINSDIPPLIYDKRFSEFMSVPALEKPSSQLYTYAVIENTDDKEYLVVVEADISPVTSTVETLRYQLIIMTVIILLISVVISVITAHYLSKPISLTNEKAKQLAQQNYDITFTSGTYKELCELNETLTYSARELQKVDTLRRELIANISHDLRTPLTMINGYAEIMRDIPGEITPENLQVIIDETNRLSRLVNELLDISKLESGTAELNLSVYSLTDSINEILKRYSTLIEKDGYKIEFEYSEQVYVSADKLRMTQVLYNLINNAVNYAGEDKTVIIRQSLKGTKVRVDVIDNGQGIEPEKIENIWDRYYKVDKEHRQSVIGTGLGLSIVKNVLNLHNATFGVESVLYRGSDFWFELDTVESPKDKPATEENKM